MAGGHAHQSGSHAYTAGGSSSNAEHLGAAENYSLLQGYSSLNGGGAENGASVQDYSHAHQVQQLRPPTEENTDSRLNLNYTTTTFPPSPSSDSHSESPTTPAHATNGHAPSSSSYNLSHILSASSSAAEGHAHLEMRPAHCLTPPHSATHKDSHQHQQQQHLSDYDNHHHHPHHQHQHHRNNNLTLPSFSSIKFTAEQIDCICDSLQQRGDVKRLENFLTSPQLDAQEEPSEAVMRAKAYAAFESGNYRELYAILESRDFDPKYHCALQDMWYRAHYREAEAVRGRSLGKSNT